MNESKIVEHLKNRKKVLEELKEGANRDTTGVPDQMIYKANQLIETRLEEVNNALEAGGITDE